MGVEMWSIVILLKIGSIRGLLWR